MFAENSANNLPESLEDKLTDVNSCINKKAMNKIPMAKKNFSFLLR
jgi:hypothetical protein